MGNVTLSRALLLHIQLMQTIQAAIKSAMMDNMKVINLIMPSTFCILKYLEKHRSTVGKHSSSFFQAGVNSFKWGAT